MSAATIEDRRPQIAATEELKIRDAVQLVVVVRGQTAGADHHVDSGLTAVHTLLLTAEALVKSTRTSTGVASSASETLA